MVEEERGNPLNELGLRLCSIIYRDVRGALQTVCRDAGGTDRQFRGSWTPHSTLGCCGSCEPPCGSGK